MGKTIHPFVSLLKSSGKGLCLIITSAFGSLQRPPSPNVLMNMEAGIGLFPPVINLASILLGHLMSNTQTNIPPES